MELFGKEYLQQEHKEFKVHKELKVLLVLRVLKVFLLEDILIRI
jgi:hypothetical protein